MARIQYSNDFDCNTMSVMSLLHFLFYLNHPSGLWIMSPLLDLDPAKSLCDEKRDKHCYRILHRSIFFTRSFKLAKTLISWHFSIKFEDEKIQTLILALWLCSLFWPQLPHWVFHEKGSKSGLCKCFGPIHNGQDYKKWSFEVWSLNPLLRPPAWQAQDQIDTSQNDLRIALQNFVF